MKTLAVAIVLAAEMIWSTGQAAPGEVRTVAIETYLNDEATKADAEKKQSDAKHPNGARADYLITVADDFIVEIYKNGQRVPDAQRTLILERFGATGEKVAVSVKDGDWLVFHVVHDRFRWNGSKYFAVAGCFGENNFGFVSDPASAEWSVCDDLAKAATFIAKKTAGSSNRARKPEVLWGEGDDFMKEFAGAQFAGKALWGGAASTWIKFVAGGANESTEPLEADPGTPPSEPGTEPSAMPTLTEARRWPVQILSAIYGTGGKNADVTAQVKEYVEVMRRKFSANPKDLGKDPNPYWNKGLHIVYIKDGVRREQRRNENETVLPESFYGPQDAAELRAWLAETRWYGSKPDVQFHADQSFTSPGLEKSARWEALSANKVRLTWPDEEPKEFVFGYTWEKFSQVGNGANVYHLTR